MPSPDPPSKRPESALTGCYSGIGRNAEDCPLRDFPGRANKKPHRVWFADIRTYFRVADSRFVSVLLPPHPRERGGNSYYCLIKACCSATPMIAMAANAAPAANVAVGPTAVQSKPATTLAASNAAPVIKL